MAKPKKQNEVATAEETEVAIPSYMADDRSDTPEGVEDITKDDWVIPRIQIVQGLSPEKNKLESKFIQGIEEGELFNTITRENMGTKIRLIPVYKGRSRAKFNPKEKGGGIGCRSQDGHTGGAIAEELYNNAEISQPTCELCPHAQWGTGKEGRGQACTEFINVLSVLNKPNTKPTISDLVSVSFKSSGIKPARDWLTLIKTEALSTKYPIYAQVWNLETIPDQNKDGERFFNWKATRDNVKHASEAAYAFCKGMRKSVVETQHEVDYSDLEPNDPSVNDTEEYS